MGEFSRTDMLETTLDALALGVFLVEVDGRVLFMNQIAERFARSGDPLRLGNGRLTLRDRTQAIEFHGVLNRTVTCGEAGAPTHSTIALPRAGGGGLIASVFRHRARSNEPHTPNRSAPISILVQDPAMVSRLPGEAFAQLYSLTQAELRVAMAMMPGVTPLSAAESLGISCNTVKTHLQRIFEKTATSRQADLLALMLRTTPPLVA